MDEYFCKLLNPKELCGMLEKWIEKMKFSHRSPVDFKKLSRSYILWFPQYL
jgi:hypothetical protein